MALTIPIDAASDQLVVLEGARATWLPQADDRWSRLRAALAGRLALLIDGHARPFPSGGGELPVPADARALELKVDGRTIASVELSAASTLRLHDPLCPFESRRLVDRGALPRAVPPPDRACWPNTDLHTHFSGCLSGSALMSIAAETRITLPKEVYGLDRDHRADQVSPPIRARLAARLQIPTDRRLTFRGMEQIYRWRSPITKARSVVARRMLLEHIARDYSAMGVRYAELSLSNIIEPEWLELAQDLVPELEAEHGVRLRFLAALSRHDDYEWDLDYIARIQQLGASPMIVGLDFMGHETNSTEDFARQLEILGDWASRERPGFVLRVHAGENAARPDNVRRALEATEAHDVQLRIGHGLYGVDDHTLERLAHADAIVEFNLNSNFALNNIHEASQAPLRRYMDAGVQVVLGTDGYGIYQTSARHEAKAALLAGLEPNDLAQIRSTEERYLAAQADRQGSLRALTFVPPMPAPVHYDQATIDARKARTRAERRAALGSALDALGVQQIDSIAVALSGRRPVSFAGAWIHSWEQMSAAQRAHAEGTVSAIIEGLDAGRHVALLGGTIRGIEGIVAARAKDCGLTVIGTIVTAQESLDELSPHLSAAWLIEGTHVDKAPALYRQVNAHDGFCLFIGGGGLVSDEIQTAVNLRLPYRVLRGTGGASELHAQRRPDHAFDRAEDVLPLLTAPESWRARRDYRYLGPNPSVDIVVFRAQTSREVLLIQRDPDAPTEAGKWALPGGFIQSSAAPGEAWQGGVESDREACRRELYEETGLDLGELVETLRFVGVFSGEHEARDPRDSTRSWSEARAYTLTLETDRADAIVVGGGDAQDARWWSIDALPEPLAFDHRRIIGAATVAPGR